MLSRSVMSNSFAVPWTVAHQAPLSMEFFRQEYWKWVAISFSRGSSQTLGSNLCLLHCRWILYHLATREALIHSLTVSKLQ